MVSAVAECAGRALEIAHLHHHPPAKHVRHRDHVVDLQRLLDVRHRLPQIPRREGLRGHLVEVRRLQRAHLLLCRRSMLSRVAPGAAEAARKRQHRAHEASQNEALGRLHVACIPSGPRAGQHSAGVSRALWIEMPGLLARGSRRFLRLREGGRARRGDRRPRERRAEPAEEIIDHRDALLGRELDRGVCAATARYDPVGVEAALRSIAPGAPFCVKTSGVAG